MPLSPEEFELWREKIWVFCEDMRSSMTAALERGIPVHFQKKYLDDLANPGWRITITYGADAQEKAEQRRLAMDRFE